ncbi:MAG: S-layer homology domain-containing protein, partial [Chloroflexia bacterium]
ATATQTNTSVPATETPTGTAVGATATSTATANTPTAVPTACTIVFADVAQDSTFYSFVRCLACRGIINGYACGGAGEPCNGNNDPYFRPANNVTRGQIAKIVSNAAGFTEPQTGQTFEDVPVGSTFHVFVERLTSRAIMSGYQCGGAGEPCISPGNRPYFRPNSNATRGQLAKIVSNAAGLNDPVTGQTFEDVAPGSTFYSFIERLFAAGVMSGYQCGGAGEPCISPGNRPYFRPANNVTRGQTSKIVSNTFFPGCSTPQKK